MHKRRPMCVRIWHMYMYVHVSIHVLFYTYMCNLIVHIHIFTCCHVVMLLSGAVLDREVDDILTLVITAEDHGVPENTGSVTMTISLLDENDNAPTFVPQFGYAVRVEENGRTGTLLLTVVTLHTNSYIIYLFQLLRNCFCITYMYVHVPCEPHAMCT